MIEAHLAATERRLFDALAAIAAQPEGWAVIGGIAAWCHLGSAHRPTLDIDAAAVPAGRATLLRTTEPGADPEKRQIGGIDVEVIDVADPSHVLGDLDPKDRLFVVGHWTAAKDPDQATVHCGPDVVPIPIARRAALVACKLHAWLDRSAASERKRASDGQDIVALLDTSDREDMITQLAANPDLRDVLAWAAQTVLIDRAHRVSHLIRVHTDEPAPGDRHVQVLGDLVVTLCEQAELDGRAG